MADLDTHRTLSSVGSPALAATVPADTETDAESRTLPTARALGSRADGPDPLVNGLAATEQPAATLPQDNGTADTLDTGSPSEREVIADRFELLHTLGEGGMGVVYKARDLELNIEVAIKFIAPQLASDSSFIEHLRSEIVLARRISHRHVCRVYDIGQHNGAYFLSMEYIEGALLGQAVDVDVLLVAEQILLALVELHKLGVVHRDLKPGNIMLDGRTGDVRVLDFGLAKDINEVKSISLGPVGTPLYWAPEQARCEGVTPATDIYSFGLIIAELWSQVPRRMGELPNLASVPKPYRSFVEQCTSSSPTERYRDGEVALRALREIRPQAPRRWMPGVSLLAAGGAALGLALLALSSPPDASLVPAPDLEAPEVRPRAAALARDSLPVVRPLIEEPAPAALVDEESEAGAEPDNAELPSDRRQVTRARSKSKRSGERRNKAPLSETPSQQHEPAATASVERTSAASMVEAPAAQGRESTKPAGPPAIASISPAASVTPTLTKASIETRIAGVNALLSKARLSDKESKKVESLSRTTLVRYTKGDLSGANRTLTSIERMLDSK